MAMTFTGCDKDSVEAFVLEGTWSGYLETYYQDCWGVTNQTYRTAMYFKQESTYSGYGYEVDYDTSNRYQGYYYSEFTWTIRDQTIYINYRNNQFSSVRIYDYKLNLATFRGRMDDGNNRDIYFDFSPTSSFDWTPYQRSFRGGVEPAP